MSDELKPIKIGFGDEKVIFRLRMISLAEQDALAQKFRDIPFDAADKHARQYQIQREALLKFSAAPPELANGAGKGKELPKDYFAEQTIKNERVINGAYLLFQGQLEPEFSFL